MIRSRYLALLTRKRKEKNTSAENSKTRALFTTVKANQNHHQYEDQAVPVAFHQKSSASENQNKVHQFTHHSSKRKECGAATSYQRSRKNHRKLLLPPFCLSSLHAFSPHVGKKKKKTPNPVRVVFHEQFGTAGTKDNTVHLQIWTWDCPRTKEFLMGTRGRPKETSSH